jgi:hypothetical protein
MMQLQRNVPIPPKRPVKDDDGRKKYPFEKMTKVGDFFFVPNRKHSSIRTYFSTAGNQYGIKLRSEQIHALEDPTGIWTQCEPEVPGAVSGVGVWRTE